MKIGSLDKSIKTMKKLIDDQAYVLGSRVRARTMHIDLATTKINDLREVLEILLEVKRDITKSPTKKLF